MKSNLDIVAREFFSLTLNFLYNFQNQKNRFSINSNTFFFPAARTNIARNLALGRETEGTKTDAIAGTEETEIVIAKGRTRTRSAAIAIVNESASVIAIRTKNEDLEHVREKIETRIAIGATEIVIGTESAKGL